METLSLDPVLTGIGTVEPAQSKLHPAAAFRPTSPATARCSTGPSYASPLNRTNVRQLPPADRYPSCASMADACVLNWSRGVQHRRAKARQVRMCKCTSEFHRQRNQIDGEGSEVCQLTDARPPLRIAEQPVDAQLVQAHRPREALGVCTDRPPVLAQRPSQELDQAVRHLLRLSRVSRQEALGGLIPDVDSTFAAHPQILWMGVQLRADDLAE
mmetsp:Transcript_119208/g.379998  ORF Transcript_119208/g.379998 Transcript_119208/m.379998 type:complete len:214 (-) Transcript_119208:764-1405(-)